MPPSEDILGPSLLLDQNERACEISRPRVKNCSLWSRCKKGQLFEGLIYVPIAYSASGIVSKACGPLFSLSCAQSGRIIGSPRPQAGRISLSVSGRGSRSGTLSPGPDVSIPNRTRFFCMDIHPPPAPLATVLYQRVSFCTYVCGTLILGTLVHLFLIELRVAPLGVGGWEQTRQYPA